jgi:hypothetical protein
LSRKHIVCPDLQITINAVNFAAIVQRKRICMKNILNFKIDFEDIQKPVVLSEGGRGSPSPIHPIVKAAATSEA